jgi:hypothetical protein
MAFLRFIFFVLCVIFDFDYTVFSHIFEPRK